MIRPEKKDFYRISTVVVLMMGFILSACLPASGEEIGQPPPLPQENGEIGAVYDSAIYANNIYKNPDLRFEALGLQEGLSNSSVTSVIQDTRGLLWFGTLDGLNKYDGYQIKIFRHDPANPNSISDNIIYDLVMDENGMLWIATDDGLNRFDPVTEHFERFQSNPDDPNSLSSNVVNDLLFGRDGDLWLATDQGVNRMSMDELTFTRYLLATETPRDLNNVVNCLFQDDNGEVWVGTASGLLLLSPRTGQFRDLPRTLDDPLQQQDPAIHVIEQVESGELWIGTSNGLFVYSPATLSVKQYLPREMDDRSLSSFVIQSVFESHNELIWIGTPNGLNLYVPAEGKFIRFAHDPLNPNSLTGNSINRIFQDQSGMIWFLSANGVNSLDINTKQFLHYRNIPGITDSLINNNVNVIHEDEQRYLWIGTTDGLDRFDRRSDHFRHFRAAPDNLTGLSDDWITAILQDSNGTLWFGTQNGGLNRYQPDNETFVHYRASPVSSNSISNDEVHFLLEDRRQRIWVATSAGMIDRFDPTTNIYSHFRLQTDDVVSQIRLRVIAMIEANDGQIWFGTTSGLYRLNPSTNQIFHYQNEDGPLAGLSDNYVLSLYQDSTGYIWIGTFGGGLNRLDPITNRFVVYTQKDGLSNDTVYGILEDAQANLWLSTNFGIVKFSPKNDTFSIFDVEDGLQSNQFNEKAYFKSRSGEFFFGGTNGLTIFFPEEVQKNPYVPPVILTALNIGGEAVETGKAPEYIHQMELSWPQNFFDFSFAALNFQQPEENQYAYFLNGFDENWNLNGPLRFGRYTNLPGGRYDLYLVATSENGIWNLSGQQVEIIVIPPFWESPLFQWGLFVLVGLALGGAYFLKVHSVQTRNTELSQMVAERTAEIEQRRQVAEGLKDVLGLLNSDQSLEESLNFIAMAAIRLSNAGHVLLLGVKDDPITCVTVRSSQKSSISSNDDGIDAEASNALINWLAQLAMKADSILVEDIQKFLLERNECVPDLLEYHSMIMIPILSGGDLFGSFVMMYHQQQQFTQEQIDLAISFADQAALAIGNAKLRERAEQTAVTAERNRLARDLHDAVTQTLFSASLIAESLPKLLETDPAEAQVMLKELRQLSRGALAEMRTLLIELRPAVVVENKLPELLKQLAEAIRGRTGMAVHLQADLPFQLPEDVHISFYRIAQEALNNVVKHAQAQKVKITLKSTTIKGDRMSVNLQIVDDGTGFKVEETQKDHFGIGIIKERAELIGAALVIDSRAGSGTLIELNWEGNAIHHE